MISQQSPSLSAKNKFAFSDEQLLSVCETANVLSCKCIAQLVGLLWETRRFYYYTSDCINRYPETAKEHYSMQEQLLQIDALLSQSLFEILQQRNLLNNQWQIDLKALKEYQLQLILHQ